MRATVKAAREQRENACAAVPKYRRADASHPTEHTPHNSEEAGGEHRAPASSAHHHRGVKLTDVLSLPWLTDVNAEPLTWAVLLWFEAPEPVACCWVVDELP